MTMIHPKPPRDINTKEHTCFFFNRHADKLPARRGSSSNCEMKQVQSQSKKGENRYQSCSEPYDPCDRAHHEMASPPCYRPRAWDPPYRSRPASCSHPTGPGLPAGSSRLPARRDLAAVRPCTARHSARTRSHPIHPSARRTDHEPLGPLASSLRMGAWRSCLWDGPAASERSRDTGSAAAAAAGAREPVRQCQLG